MWSVLFHRPDRDNDGMMLLQEDFEFGVRKFSQKYGGWFHASSNLNFRQPYGCALRLASGKQIHKKTARQSRRQREKQNLGGTESCGKTTEPLSAPTGITLVAVLREPSLYQLPHPAMFVEPQEWSDFCFICFFRSYFVLSHSPVQRTSG